MLARSLVADAAVRIPRAAGHALYQPGALNRTKEVVAFAQEAVHRVNIEQRKRKANKPFMLKLLPSVSLTLESPLLSLALRREIVAHRDVPGTRAEGMSRGLLKLSGGSVHDYATIF